MYHCEQLPSIYTPTTISGQNISSDEDLIDRGGDSVNIYPQDYPDSPARYGPATVASSSIEPSRATFQTISGQNISSDEDLINRGGDSINIYPQDYPDSPARYGPTVASSSIEPSRATFQAISGQNISSEEDLIDGGGDSVDIYPQDYPDSPARYGPASPTIASSTIEPSRATFQTISGQNEEDLIDRGGDSIDIYPQDYPDSPARYGPASPTVASSTIEPSRATFQGRVTPCRVSESYPCHPLAMKYVVEELNQCLLDIGESRFKITAEKGAISLSAEAAVADQYSCLINSSISDHEAGISSIEETMHCCYLPVLADRSVQEQLAKSQVPFEVKIFEAGGYVPLEKLTYMYSKCDKITTEADELARYLQPAGNGELTCYRWYWESKFGFYPYGTSVSGELERVLCSKGTMVLSIRPYSYVINTWSMTQTNTATGNVRKVERRPVHGAMRHNISIQITARSYHLQEAQREISECLRRNIKEARVSLHQDTSSVDHLLQIAQWGFIYAQKTDGNDVILWGKPDVVTDVELNITRELLQMREVVKPPLNVDPARTRPHYWEPQERNCELKQVSRGSDEWAGVQQRFCSQILRIERIQNLWLWEVYDHSLKRVSSKNGGEVNEKWLFHGTKKISPVKIYNSEQGFDNRLSSRGMWGEGAYFAVRAQYSDSFAHTTPEGHRQMFLVKVITGITCKCRPDSSLKAPPIKTARSPSLQSCSFKSMFEDERYDSVSGDTSTSEVFVIYEQGKVYPAYLITYFM